MKGIFKKLALLTLFTIATLFSLPHSTHAIGGSPAVIYEPIVLRGVAKSVHVNIGRAPNEKGDLHIDVMSFGEAGKYLKFEPKLIIPADKISVVFPFSIDGASAPIGSYKAILTFSLNPIVSETPVGIAYLAVTTGVSIIVNYTVSGDQVVSYTLERVIVADTETNLYPLATFIMTNTGNVDWKPDSANITFINQEDGSQTASSIIDKDQFSLIPPGKHDAQRVEIQKNLPEGKYKMTADIIFGGVSVGTMLSEQFSVFAPGTLKQSGQLLSSTIKKTVFNAGESIPVTGSFKNDGQISVKGIYGVEVYRDGTYEDLVLSDEIVINIGETTEVTVVIRPKGTGNYTLTTYFKYANRKSNIIEVALTVTGGPLAFLNSPITLGVIISGILLIIGIILVRRRKKSIKLVVPKAPTYVPAAPVTAPKVKPVPIVKPTRIPVQPKTETPVASSTPRKQPRRRW